MMHCFGKISAALVIFGSLGPSTYGVAQPLEVLYEFELPAALSRAYEARWYDSDSVLVSTGRSWVAVLDLEQEAPNRFVAGEIHRIPIEANGSRGRAVARSGGTIAVSDLSRGIAWKGAEEKSIREVYHHGFVMDFDLHGDRVVLLGHHFMKDGAISPEGEIAWLGSLSDRLAEIETVLYSPITQLDKTPMGQCGWMRFGAVRFLQNGSFVVVPGVEDHVFLFDAQGRLKRTWDTKELGIDAGCTFPGVDAERLEMNVELRYRAVINRRHIVDEILPLQRGAALVVRSADDAATRWQLKLLEAPGSVKTMPVPFTQDTAFGLLSGDVLADKILFLVRDDILDPVQATASARLVVTTSP